MCCSCHNVGILHWIRMNTCCNKSCKMSHINHKYCPDFICNFSEFPGFYYSWISTRTCNNHFGFKFIGKSSHFIKINRFRLRIQTIRNKVKYLPEKLALLPCVKCPPLERPMPRTVSPGFNNAKYTAMFALEPE